MKKTILVVLLLVQLNTFAAVQIKTFSYEWALNSWIKENEKKVDVIAVRPYVVADNNVKFMIEYYEADEN